MPNDPLKPVRDAIAGLEYPPSESDSPFDVFDWPALSLPNGTVTEMTAARFFDPLKTVTDAAKFDRLHKALDQLVNPIRVFRVTDGSAVVQIYVLGKTPAGRFVGVHTSSVET